MSNQTLSQNIASVKTNTAIRIAAGLALSFISGIMLTAAFAPYNAWPLVFAAFVPLIIAQYRVISAKLSNLAPAVTTGTWLYLYFGPSFFPRGIMLGVAAIRIPISIFISMHINPRIYVIQKDRKKIIRKFESESTIFRF